MCPAPDSDNAARDTSPGHDKSLDTFLLQEGARLLATSSAELDQVLQTTLAQLVAELGIGFAILRLYHAAGETLAVVQHVAAGDLPTSVIPNDFDTYSPWYVAAIRAGAVVCVPHIPDDLPPAAAAERTYMTEIGIRSLLLVAIPVVEHTFASLACATYTDDYVWTAPIQQSLGAFAKILGGLLRRQQTEAAAQGFQEQLHATIEAAQVDVWTLDLRHPAQSYTTTFDFSNGRRPPNQLPQVLALFLDNVHPDDRGELNRQLSRCIAGELETFTQVYRLHTGDAGYSWMESRAYLVRDDQGLPLHLTGITQDITARKTVEDQLARQARLMDQTEQLGKIGGWELDLITNALYWSPQTYRIHEVTPAEFVPTLADALQFYAPNSVPLITAAVQRVASTGEPFDLKLQLITAKQRLIWVRAAGSAEFVDGQPVRLFGSFQDITDRVEVEEQLRQAQQMEVVGQLAGGIAHDFNNLLTAINGLSELAAIYLNRAPSVPEIERVRHYLAEINNAGRRAADLTRQMLAFSRRQILRPQLLDLAAVVVGLLPKLHQLLGDRVDLATYAEEGLGKVLADPAQIEQILLSLVDNAGDAMPNGGVVSVELHNVALAPDDALRYLGLSAGDHVVLSVHDTGVGMTPEVQQHCFEPFFTTKPVGKGTGLGLAMVYGIVQQSGGHIAVESAPGQGTTFRILFPRNGELPPSAAAGTTPPRPERKTILLVEGSGPVRAQVRAALKRAEYSVLEAKSGEEALNLCDGYLGPIHLLVIHVPSGEINVEFVVARLRQLRPYLKSLVIPAADAFGTSPALDILLENVRQLLAPPSIPG